MKKTLLLALSSVLLLSSCAIGRMDFIGSFDITGRCEFELRFEIIQQNGVVASAEFSNALGTDFRDGNVNYGAPMQIHVAILRSTAACPPSLTAPNHHYWPSASSMGTLKPLPNGRYQVDLKAFQTMIRPGSISVR